MKKKIIAGIFAFMLVSSMTGCGAKSENTQTESSAEVSTEETAPVQAAVSAVTTVSSAMETVPTSETEAEEPTEEQGSYLSQIMFVGDEMVAGFIGKNGIDESRVFYVDGADADDFEERTINGTKIGRWAEENKPEYIYIWIGTHDLNKGNDYQYYLGMSGIIKELHDSSPDSIIAVMSITPVAESSSWDDENCDGEAYYDSVIYNRMIKDELMSDLGYDILEYINVDEVLALDGYQNPEYDSGDGMHINDAGYEALCKYITDNRFNNNGMSADINAETDGTDVSAENGEDTENPEEADGGETREKLSDEVDEEDYQKSYPDLYAERPEWEETDGKVCYLTFDDGPSSNTEEILDILAEKNVKATFFVVGQSIDGREDILKRIIDEGHTLGIHTYSHDYELIYQSTEAYLEDFNSVYNLIYDVTGYKTWLFRFPGGSRNSFNTETADDIIREMKRRGFEFFDWTSATSDATVGATYSSCIENYKDTMGGNHETVLMHDSKSLTAEYLREIIDYADEEGYSFETLDNADAVHF